MLNKVNTMHQVYKCFKERTILSELYEVAKDTNKIYTKHIYATNSGNLPCNTTGSPLD